MKTRTCFGIGVSHLLLAACAMLLLSPPGIGAAPLKCLDCHDNVTAQSVHDGAADCAECHKDVVNESHETKGVAPVKCGNCHEDEAEGMKQDIHHRLVERVGDDPPECVTCHGSHEVVSPAESKDPVADYCSDCHDNVLPVKGFHQVGFIPNQECLECHDDVAHLQPDLAASVHAGFACVDCHAYVLDNPEKHQDSIPYQRRADCNGCHRAETLLHRESIHGISLHAGIDEAAQCQDCHGSHRILPVKDPANKAHAANQPKTCGVCHDDPKFLAKFSMGIDAPGKLYSQSVHGKLVQKGRLDAADCTFCHGVHDIKNRVQPGSRISPFTVPDTCGQCHVEIAAEFKESIHWILAKRGIRKAPVCNDCHSEHSIHAISTVDKNMEVRKIQEQTCFQCHQDPIVAARYGLSGDQPKQYQDSYHGMAVMRGDREAAMCIDCHGVHKILPKQHPESRVHSQNVTEVCRNCHVRATAKFAISYSHHTELKSSRMIETWVRVIYLWIIALTIGGMLIHNILIFSFEVRRARQSAKRLVSIPRLTPNEVAQHLVLIASFVVLVFTGFALKYPDWMLFSWMEWAGMTELIRKNTHRTAAVVLLVLGVYHLLYLVVTQRGRDVLSQLALRAGDLKDFVNNMLYHLRLRREGPHHGQFDYTEKVEYWALVWGTIVMAATGIVLWNPEFASEQGPGWVIKVSEIIHFYEAILATLSIIVWHGFFVMFHPRDYPMSFTWLDGKMTLEHYKHHHRRQYDALLSDWQRLKLNKATRAELGHFSRMVFDRVEANGQSLAEIFQTELDQDPEVRAAVEREVGP